MSLTLLVDRSEDGSHIEVRQDGTPPRHIRTVMRAIAPGAIWLPKQQVWQYPYSSGVFLSLTEAAALLPADVTLAPALGDLQEKIASENAQEHAARRLIQTYIDSPGAPLAEYITADHKRPWRHQQIAWHWAMRTATLYLAHKPGLGKSRSYMDIIRGKYDLGQTRSMQQTWLPDRPSAVSSRKTLSGRWGVIGGVLVVCPSVVLDTLEEELFEFQSMEALIIRGNSYYKTKKAGIPAWVHIINYESLEYVEGNMYDGIVSDEIHYLANDSSQRWSRMMALRKDARWVLGGSGTPVSNMLPSLWAQYMFLDGGRSLGTSYDRFIETFFEKVDRGKPEAKNDAADRIAQAISRVTYFLRKEDALPDMPKKIVQPLYFPMTRQQADYYERIRHDAEADIMTGTVTTTDTHIKLMKLLQVCQGFVRDDDEHDLTFNSAKLSALEGMLTGHGDLTDRKVVVWCRFLPDVDAISKMLTKHGIQHLRFQGDGYSQAERDEIRQRWQTEPEWRVIIGMIQLGIGIQLHARDCVRRDAAGQWVTDRCSTAIFYGLDWSVVNLEQSMDRIHRGDQVETCLYRFLLSTAPDKTGEPDEEDETIPLDIKVFRRLQEKMRVSDGVFEEGQGYYRRLLARGDVA